MFKKEEFFFNFLAFKLVAFFNFLPVTIDQKAGEIHVRESKWRWRNFHFFYTLFFLDILFIYFRFAQAYLLPSDASILYIPINVEYCLGLLVVYVLSLYYFLIYPDLFVMNYNRLFKSRRKHFEKEIPESYTRWSPFQYTKTEIYSLLFPLLILEQAVGSVIAFIQERTIPYMLFSVLHPVHQTDFLFTIFMAVETMVICTWLSISPFCFDFIFLFFQQTHDTLELYLGVLKKYTRLSGRQLQEMLLNLEHIRISICFFNICSSVGLYVWKLYCISVTIAGGFFAIRYYSENETLGFVNYLNFFNSIAFFILTFSRAFPIPQKIDLLKKELHRGITFSTSLNAGHKKYLSKRLDSVKVTGIEVGGFGWIERTSTLLFLNFITFQIVSLLLAYK